MVGCIVTGHGSFAEGMLGAFEMIAGPQEALVAVPFHEEDAAAYPGKIREAIAAMAGECGSALVFCDLMGGTPFNQSMLAAAEIAGVEVVAGTNLPMLLETITSRDFTADVCDLADLAADAGSASVAHAVPLTAADADDASDDEGEGI